MRHLPLPERRYFHGGLRCPPFQAAPPSQRLSGTTVGAGFEYPILFCCPSGIPHQSSPAVLVPMWILSTPSYSLPKQRHPSPKWISFCCWLGLLVLVVGALPLSKQRDFLCGLRAPHTILSPTRHPPSPESQYGCCGLSVSPIYFDSPLFSSSDTVVADI